MYEKQQLNHTIDMQKLEHNNIILQNKLEMQKEKYDGASRTFSTSNHELLKKEVEIMKMQIKK